MSLVEVLLLIMSGSLLLGTPLYIFYRNEMMRKQRNGSGGFSHRRIIRLTLLNILLISFVYLFFQLLFMSVLRFQFPTSITSRILCLSFLLVTALTCYGSGIYITAIVLEAFTLPQLRTHKAFRTQFVATYVFHGPISHFFIYSGYISAFFLLALIEFVSPFDLTLKMPVALLGLPIGVIYALAQIYNKTYRYQMVVGLFCFLAYLFTVTILNPTIYVSTLGVYFLGFTFTLSLTLLCRYLYIKNKKTLLRFIR